MAYTEKEIEELEKEAFENRTLDKEIEVIWIKEQIPLNRKSEQQQLFLFRYHKAMRNDDGIKTSSDTLKVIKKTIEYLENRLKELNA